MALSRHQRRFERLPADQQVAWKGLAAWYNQPIERLVSILCLEIRNLLHAADISERFGAEDDDSDDDDEEKKGKDKNLLTIVFELDSSIKCKNRGRNLERVKDEMFAARPDLFPPMQLNKYTKVVHEGYTSAVHCGTKYHRQPFEIPFRHAQGIFDTLAIKHPVQQKPTVPSEDDEPTDDEVE
jgi:hypothetical protein